MKGWVRIARWVRLLTWQHEHCLMNNLIHLSEMILLFNLSLSMQVSRYSLFVINEIGTISRQRNSLKSISSNIAPYSFRGITNVWDGSNFQSTSIGIQSNKVYANLHLPSGLGTIRTWLHIGAVSVTPSFQTHRGSSVVMLTYSQCYVTWRSEYVFT